MRKNHNKVISLHFSTDWPYTFMTLFSNWQILLVFFFKNQLASFSKAISGTSKLLTYWVFADVIVINGDCMSETFLTVSSSSFFVLYFSVSSNTQTTSVWCSLFLLRNWGQPLRELGISVVITTRRMALLGMELPSNHCLQYKIIGRILLPSTS